MVYYHGSPTSGIEILKPHISNHKNPYVYFSSLRSVAIFYTVRKNWYPYGFVGEERIPEYTEYYPDALKDVYARKKGYIYECEAINIVENPTNIYCAYVSLQPVKVKRQEYIADVFLELLKLESEGEILIKRYPDLTEKDHVSKSKMIVREILSEGLISKGGEYAAFIKEKFPEEWQNALRMNAST